MVIQAPHGATPLEYPRCAKRLAIAKQSEVNSPKIIGTTAGDLFPSKLFSIKVPYN
jgi:hypothetical protein